MGHTRSLSVSKTPYFTKCNSPCFLSLFAAVASQVWLLRTRRALGRQKGNGENEGDGEKAGAQQVLAGDKGPSDFKLSAPVHCRRRHHPLGNFACRVSVYGTGQTFFLNALWTSVQAPGTGMGE